MKEFLRSNYDLKNITQFVFPLYANSDIEKIKWENRNEFSLNGEMYDVIDQKTENAKLVIRCINDKQESSLIKDYEKINKDTQNDSSSNNKSATLLKLVTTPFVISKLSSLHILKGRFIVFLKPIQNNISSGIKDILTPPPQDC